jgi:hypothetical protein
MILSPLNQLIMVNKAVTVKGVADLFLVSLTRAFDQLSSLVKDSPPALKVDIKIETVVTTQLTDPQGRLLPDGWALATDEKDRVTYRNLDRGQIIWYNPNDIVKDVDIHDGLSRDPTTGTSSTIPMAERSARPPRSTIQRPQRSECVMQ